MPIHIRFISLTILMICCFPAAAEDVDSWTVGELFKRLQYETLLPVLNYCSSELPATEAANTRIYNNFIAKVSDASDLISGKLDKDWDAPIPAAEAERTLSTMSTIMKGVLPQIEEVGAASYCPVFTEKLDAATSELLAEKIMTAYNEYLQKQSPFTSK